MDTKNKLKEVLKESNEEKQPIYLSIGGPQHIGGTFNYYINIPGKNEAEEIPVKSS